jgi:WD40 repeat protein
MISPVQSSVVPATRSAPRPGKHGFACGVFVVCSALSAGACWALAFDPLASPVRSGSPGPPADLPALLVPAWPVTGVLYAFLWVSLPVLLLLAGIGLIRFAVPGWRWHLAWAGAAAAGIALDLLGLLALNQFGSHPRYWLGLSIGFAVLGAMTIWVSAGAVRSSRRVGRLDRPSPGPSAAPGRAGAARGSAARRERIAALVIGGAALLIGVAAIAVVLTRSSRPALSLTGSGVSVGSVAFSPDGKILAVADEEGSIRLWNAATGRQLALLASAGRRAAVDSVGFSPDGKILAAGDEVGTAYLWNPATSQLLATLRDPGRQASADAVAFSPDGKILAIGDGDGGTYLWNTAARRRLATLPRFPDGGVNAVAFSPDGKILAIGDGDGRTYLWNVAGGTLTAAMQDPGSVGAVAFSPDGRILATDDAGPGTYLWNLATGTRTALRSEGSFDGLGSLAFSPDGRTLAIAGGGAYAGSASVWNVATSKLIAVFSDPSGYAISSVAFSPDGKALAGGDNYDASQPATIPARTYVWDVGGLP